ncbi:MAG: hypothetical protein KF887_03195 [Paracoccaceae bacterium]|nr:MAG: hypothetical protein KF887_03195 [Paracoccaceae bacterium]
MTAAVLAAAPAMATAGGPATVTVEPDVVVAQPAPAPKWQVQVMPYVWASGMTGSIRPFTGAPTVSFSKSFSDTLEDLDAAFFLSASAQRDRWVLLGDFSRVVTSRAGTVPGGLPAEGGLKQTTLTLAGGYKAVVGPTYSVDVFAGFRAFWLGADVTVAGGAVSASPRRNFVDPIIGLRASAMLAPRWSGMLYADVGGFGVGTESTVVLSGLLNYHVSERVTVSGGYRTMWIDYDDRGTLADVTLGGPILGVSWRF